MRSVLRDVLTVAVSMVDTKIKLGAEDVGFKGAELTKTMEALKKSPSTPMAAVVEAYQKALADRCSSGAVPAIILDEANKLSGWAEEHQKDLQDLLDFFVAVSKQQRISHVLLITSEYAFLTWLQSRIGRGFYQVRVFGDFEKGKAEGFAKEVRHRLGLKALAPQEWESVYEVCGGNPGLLQQVAESSDWDRALRYVLDPVGPAIEAGLTPDEDAGFTGEQFIATMSSIVESPHNAVISTELVQSLGGGSQGQAALQAMVKQNLVAYRPYSDWAKDIPVAAFGTRRQPVVTAPLPVDLYHMTKLVQELKLKKTGNLAEEAAMATRLKRLANL